MDDDTDEPAGPVPDTTMVRIGEGMALAQRGERQAARALFAAVWDEIGGDAGDAFHRCALAHSMADVQDETEEELRWDLRALDAAELITEERAAQGGVAGPVRGFYPSLHLNIAECYRKLRDLPRARHHLRCGQAALGALGDDGYARMITGGLDRLAAGLDAAGCVPVRSAITTTAPPVQFE